MIHNHEVSGSIPDLATTFKKHNQGSTPSTKPGIPWVLVYSEMLESKHDAIIREQQIKKMKSRIFIESLIRNSRTQ